MSKPVIYKWSGDWHVLNKKTGLRVIAGTWRKAWKEYEENRISRLTS